jgi:hypothetical protein
MHGNPLDAALLRHLESYVIEVGQKCSDGKLSGRDEWTTAWQPLRRHMRLLQVGLHAGEGRGGCQLR